jgi:hypothetical protein
MVGLTELKKQNFKNKYMETVINIWNQLSAYLDVTYLLIFMMLGYLIKEYLQGFLSELFHRTIPFVFVILILATIVSIPFLISGTSWQKILLSYALGTSLHEVAFSFLENKIKNILGKENPNKDKYNEPLQQHPV